MAVSICDILVVLSIITSSSEFMDILLIDKQSGVKLGSAKGMVCMVLRTVTRQLGAPEDYQDLKAKPHGD